MTVVELLDALRGTMTKRAFAERLGISVRMMTAMYAGERRPGGLVLRALAKEYPDKQYLVVQFFLASPEHERASGGTLEPTG